MPLFRTKLNCISNGDKTYIPVGGVVELPDESWWSALENIGWLVRCTGEVAVPESQPSSLIQTERIVVPMTANPTPPPPASGGKTKRKA